VTRRGAVIVFPISLGLILLGLHYAFAHGRLMRGD